jgi:ABC-2 type transport system permease protein
MLRSLRVMIWKEWVELKSSFFNWSRWNPVIFPQLVMVAAFGIYEPIHIGPDWITSPIMIFCFSILLPFITVGTNIPYSFIGERERHTLEPLLATPTPNAAILLGKITVPTFYGWCITIICMVTSLVSINLAFGQEGILFYPANIAFSVMILSLLFSLLVASLGTAASLRAKTVNQVQQTMMLILILPMLIPAFLLGPLSPSSWKAAAAQPLTLIGYSNFSIILDVIILSFIIAAILITLSRFHRETLLLGK